MPLPSSSTSDDAFLEHLIRQLRAAPPRAPVVPPISFVATLEGARANVREHEARSSTPPERERIERIAQGIQQAMDLLKEQVAGIEEAMRIHDVPDRGLEQLSNEKGHSKHRHTAASATALMLHEMAANTRNTPLDRLLGTTWWQSPANVLARLRREVAPTTADDPAPPRRPAETSPGFDGEAIREAIRRAHEEAQEWGAWIRGQAEARHRASRAALAGALAILDDSQWSAVLRHIARSPELIEELTWTLPRERAAAVLREMAQDPDIVPSLFTYVGLPQKRPSFLYPSPSFSEEAKDVHAAMEDAEFLRFLEGALEERPSIIERVSKAVTNPYTAIGWLKGWAAWLERPDHDARDIRSTLERISRQLPEQLRKQCPEAIASYIELMRFAASPAKHHIDNPRVLDALGRVARHMSNHLHEDHKVAMFHALRDTLELPRGPDTTVENFTLVSQALEIVEREMSHDEREAPPERDSEKGGRQTAKRAGYEFLTSLLRVYMQLHLEQGPHPSTDIMGRIVAALRSGMNNQGLMPTKTEALDMMRHGQNFPAVWNFVVYEVLPYCEDPSTTS